MSNPEHYAYIKATFDCGEISWKYRLNGSEIVGRGCDDQDPEDCMDYSDEDIKELVRGQLCVAPDDPVVIEVEFI
ncbi:MAG: hypothetical protein KDN05_19515 [Verrucomicrobiae bacterium]|nr:hypothetical protein [Verrucomicrobiae bacterium]